MTRVVCAFTYDGPAVGKGRPRVTTAGGFARAYTPDKTRKFEMSLATFAQVAVRDQGPMAVEEAVRLDVMVTRAPLKSWSKKKAAAMLGTRVTGKPDIDNIAKAIGDALNGVAYLDDGQITELAIRRIWGARDAIAVRVTAFPDMEQAA